MASIIDSRNEDMFVFPSGGWAYNRLGYFLSPTAAQSGDSAPLPHPSPAPPSSAVKFQGWRTVPKNWQEWTAKMLSLHSSVWENAGICEAVLNSCHVIVPSHDVVLGLVQRWNPETNTFVLPWGEVTVTLEDVAIIGGYSVLGGPVFSPIDSPEMSAAIKLLKEARKEVGRRPANKVHQNKWSERFFSSSSDIEHEAFLAMWLSRFVFPKSTLSDTVDSRVSGLSVLLARGVRIALAPAILTNIYASLTEIKEYMVKGDFSKKLRVSAPLQLLQIWIWERFPGMRPEPSVQVVHPGHAWFSRWDMVRLEEVPSDVQAVIDGASGDFIWRPYYRASSTIRIFGAEPRVCHMIGSDQLDDDVAMLIRILRCSQLVGMEGCIERYLPHRVAMQLGYDQDIPGLVALAGSSGLVAWEEYSRVVTDRLLYIVPRWHVSSVSSRYYRWWRSRPGSSTSAPALKKVKEEPAASSSQAAVAAVGPPPGYALTEGAIFHQVKDGSAASSSQAGFAAIGPPPGYPLNYGAMLRLVKEEPDDTI